MDELSRGDVNRIFLWTLAVPVLGAWPMVSALPVFGLFQTGAPALSIAGDLLFLAAGFWGLGTVYAVAVFSARPGLTPALQGALRGRVGLVTAYALAWMTLYWLFKGFVV